MSETIKLEDLLDSNLNRHVGYQKVYLPYTFSAPFSTLGTPHSSTHSLANTDQQDFPEKFKTTPTHPQIVFTFVLAVSCNPKDQEGNKPATPKSKRQKKDKRKVKEKKKDKENEQKNKIKAKKEDKKDKKKGKSVELKENVPQPEEFEDGIKLPVGKPKLMIHLEYQLLPGHDRVLIDIVSWGAVFKVYTKESVVASKEITRNDSHFICFSVCHLIKNMDMNQLKDLYNHSVVVDVTTGKTKVGAVAASDSPYAFYWSTLKVGHPLPEVYELLPDDSKKIYPKITKIDLSDLSVPKIWLENNPNSYHLKTIQRMLKHITAESQDTISTSLVKKVVIIDERTTKKSKGKKAKKDVKDKGNKNKKKGKNKRNAADDTSRLILRAENYFAELSVISTGAARKSSDVCYAGMISSVANLMDALAKQMLNPLVVQIYGIRNVPVDFLRNHGITGIFTKYSLPDEISSKSERKKLSKNVDINDNRVFLTSEVSGDYTKQEFFHRGEIIIEVYGVKETKECESGLIFGQDVDDIYIYTPSYLSRKCHHLDCGDETLFPLLCVARIPMDRLYNCQLLIEGPERLFSPTEITTTSSQEKIPSIVNILEIYHRRKKKFYPCLLPNSVLLTCGTYIDVGIKLTRQPIINSEINLVSQDGFHRIAIMVECDDAAERIFHTVTSLNQYIESQPLLVHSYLDYFHNRVYAVRQSLPDYAQFIRNAARKDLMEKELINKCASLHQSKISGVQTNKLACHSTMGEFLKDLISKSDAENQRVDNPTTVQDDFDDKHSDKMLTGFFIEDFNRHIFFVEAKGLQGFKKLEYIMDKCACETDNTTFVLFNRNLVFPSREYEDFMDHGGIYAITLKEPLNKLLLKYETYLHGHIPLPCFRAIRKLDLLLKTKCMKTATVMNLFPTASELLCLNAEFGVPLRCTC